MIPYQDLAGLILSGVGVDAEGSGRYSDVNDIIPSINSAIDRSVYAGNYAMANRKFSEEIMSELQETRIIQTNQFGGITLDELYIAPNVLFTKGVWTVLAIIANPDIGPTGPPSFFAPASRTYVRPDAFYLQNGLSERPVARKTVEQVARSTNDATLPGNEILAGNPKMAEFAYYIEGLRTEDDVQIEGSREIVLSPRSLFVPGPKFVAMSYLRVPARITTVNDIIDMPASTLRLLADWALEYLSWKQGDGTTLNAVASKDANALFGMQL